MIKFVDKRLRYFNSSLKECSKKTKIAVVGEKTSKTLNDFGIVESAKTVISEEPEKRSSLLPNKPAEEQYEFAVSFMKIGDYETAEFALKEFIFLD